MIQTTGHLFEAAIHFEGREAITQLRFHVSNFNVSGAVLLDGTLARGPPSRCFADMKVADMKIAGRLMSASNHGCECL